MSKQESWKCACGTEWATGLELNFCGRCGLRKPSAEQAAKPTLSAAEAMGVAISIPMSGTSMGRCQELAPGVLDHLAKLGYQLVNAGAMLEAATRAGLRASQAVTAFESAATEWRKLCSND